MLLTRARQTFGRHFNWHVLGAALSVALVVLCGLFLFRFLSDLDIAGVVEALRKTPLPNLLADVWRALAKDRPRPSGPAGDAVPILSRAVALGGDGPIRAIGALDVEGTYQFAHTVGADGEVDRILLRMWARASGVIGHVNFTLPDAGRPIAAGRMFAEHVFTRPFGSPSGVHRSHG